MKSRDSWSRRVVVGVRRFVGRHLASKSSVAVVAAMATVFALTVTAPATSYAQDASSSYPVADLLNQSALSLTAPTPADPNPAHLYAATPDQVAALQRLEAQAVADTLHDHGLPEKDTAAVKSWGRADAEAELWALLIQAIKTPAASRTSDQARAVAWLTAVVNREGILAADAAGMQYTKWAGLGTHAYQTLLASNPSKTALSNFFSGTPLPYTDGGSASSPGASKDGGYCVYAPPSPYQGDYTSALGGSTTPQTCFTPCTNVFGCLPPTPSLQNFVKWGDAKVSDTLFDNPGYATAVNDVAVGSTMAAGTIGAAGAAVGTTFALQPVMSGTSFQQSVFPFTARPIYNTKQRPTAQQEAQQEQESVADEEGVIEGELEAEGESAADAAAEATTEAVDAAAQIAEEVAGYVAATGVGVIVAAIIFAVTTAVMEAIPVIGQAELPGQLATLVAGAPGATPDLSSMAGNPGDLAGLFGLFVGATQPAPVFKACSNSGLILSSPVGVAYPACMNAPAVPASASTDPQFIVQAKGANSTSTQPVLTWADATNGLSQTARLHGNWFIDLAAIPGQQPTLTQTLRMTYTDWNGDEHTAWLFDADSTPKFLTISDKDLGADFDPTTCVSSGACAWTSAIKLVGANGIDQTVSVKAGGVPTPTPPPAPPMPPTDYPHRVDTHLKLTAVPAHPLVGQTVTYTATLTTPGEVPLSIPGHHDIINFSDGYVTKCSVPVGNGTNEGPFVRTCKVTYSSAGPVYMFATFEGDQLHGFNGFWNGPSQDELTLNVTNQAPTTTSVTASTSTPEVDEQVIYTATITDDTGTVPTGSVLFQVGAATVCADPAPSGPSDGPWTARCAYTYTSAGTQKMTVQYSGDAHTASSSGTATATVSKVPTGTVLNAGLLLAYAGQPVTYTATISDRLLPPTGTVTFTSGDATLCAKVKVAVDGTSGTAACTWKWKKEGFETVTASYSGNATAAPSSNTWTVHVLFEPTTTALTSAPDAPVAGQKVTYTATVTDSDGLAPTGSVEFFDNDTKVCAAAPLSANAPYTATCTQTYPVAGTHRVTAIYVGDAGTFPSTAHTLTAQVGKVTTTTTVSAPTAAVVGQRVTYTATVGDGSGPAPTGTVSFTDAGTTVCTKVALSQTAPYTATCTHTYPSPGKRTVTAAYAGDDATTTSSGSATVTVGKAASTTAMTSSPASPSFGQPVTFTATVAPQSGTHGPAPTGTVRFTVDGHDLGAPVALSAAGTATSPADTTLAPGSHTVLATYSGDGNYTGSKGTHAEAVSCSQTISSNASGPVTVTGSTCVQAGASVNGPITVRAGGALALTGATVHGPIRVDGAASVLICGSSLSGPVSASGVTGPILLGGAAGSACAADHISGPVQISGAHGAVAISRTSVAGPVSVQDGSAGVLISGVTIRGPLSVAGNSGVVTLSHNTVHGPVSVDDNHTSGPAVVSANTIGGPLACAGNTPGPVDAGTANQTSGPASGQCSGLG